MKFVEIHDKAENPFFHYEIMDFLRIQDVNEYPFFHYEIRPNALYFRVVRLGNAKRELRGGKYEK